MGKESSLLTSLLILLQQQLPGPHARFFWGVEIHCSLQSEKSRLLRGQQQPPDPHGLPSCVLVGARLYGASWKCKLLNIQIVMHA